LGLPYFGGWNLIGRLRIQEGKPIKIIATTSIYSKPVLEKTKECGVAEAVVRKPIPHEEWRTALETERFLRENSAEMGRVKSFV
jgi:CheY-like chemotaxis protein